MRNVCCLISQIWQNRFASLSKPVEVAPETIDRHFYPQMTCYGRRMIQSYYSFCFRVRYHQQFLDTELTCCFLVEGFPVYAPIQEVDLEKKNLTLAMFLKKIKKCTKTYNTLQLLTEMNTSGSKIPTTFIPCHTNYVYLGRLLQIINKDLFPCGSSHNTMLYYLKTLTIVHEL